MDIQDSLPDQVRYVLRMMRSDATSSCIASDEEHLIRIRMRTRMRMRRMIDFE